jgi:MFS family permease
MGGTAGARGARAEALRSPRYWTISVAFGLGLAAQVGMLTHFIAFLAPIHGTAGAASALGVTTFTALIARFAVGALLDQFDRRAVSAVVLLTQATGLLLLLLGSSSAALYAGCALFGIGVGNMVTLPGLLLQREVRAEHFAAVIGLLAATNQFTYSLAPGLLGMLRDATGDYQAAVLLCIGMELLGAAVIVAGHRIGKRAQAARSAGMVALQSPGAIPSGDAMLQLRPNCECCDRDLPPDSREAMICSFECTFCRTCVETVLGGRCPNCGGEFVQRPIRPPAKLAKYPASVERVVRREPPCADVA